MKIKCTKIYINWNRLLSWQQIQYTCLSDNLDNVKYFQCKDELLNPKGSLSLLIQSRTMASANKEVDLTKSVSKKLGPY